MFMEQVTKDTAFAHSSADKSKVLNVKPLRCLAPKFPNPPGTDSFSTPFGSPPFVCVPPRGPFPPGISPFFPFPDTQPPPKNGGGPPSAPPRSSSPPQFMHSPGSSRFSDATPISAVPISSLQTQNGQIVASDCKELQIHNGGTQFLSSFSMHVAEIEDSGDKRGVSVPRSRKRERGNEGRNVELRNIDADSMVNEILKAYDLIGPGSFREDDGDPVSVQRLLLVFDLLRRKFALQDDPHGPASGHGRRPDLKAATALSSRGIKTNANRRVGPIPGIEVGDIFFFRMELCVIGLHGQSMAGIDYMPVKICGEDAPLAISIVSSGGYENDDVGDDVLIYSGHGGNLHKKDKDMKMEDQKLERGNLALEKSLFHGNEVRVTRGLRDPSSPAGKIYTYDGLFRIQESWIEKGRSGHNLFKYKLLRLPGQPEAFKLWKTIQQWRDGVAPRPGNILPDLTSKAENLPVALVNEVTDEKGPAYFTYTPSVKSCLSLSPDESFMGCTCVGGCVAGNDGCPCIGKNGGHFPYLGNGVLVDKGRLVYECGPSCHCPASCRNRATQGGLRFRLEVFRTGDRGWGLRSWDPIRAGSYICEYAGELVTAIERNPEEEGEDYVFDGTRVTHPLGQVSPITADYSDLPYPLIIDAKHMGNVARFMNHSCAPNVFWQPVLHANGSELDVHVVFHAINHIPPLRELTYDYGAPRHDTVQHVQRACLCGSPKCCGFF